MGLRSCTVSCFDLRGCEHTVEVTADSLYEAVAQGLRVFRENDWAMTSDVAGRPYRWLSGILWLSTKFACKTLSGGWNRKGAHPLKSP